MSHGIYKPTYNRICHYGIIWLRYIQNDDIGESKSARRKVWRDISVDGCNADIVVVTRHKHNMAMASSSFGERD